MNDVIIGMIAVATYVELMMFETRGPGACFLFQGQKVKVIINKDELINHGYDFFRGWWNDHDFVSPKLSDGEPLPWYWELGQPHQNCK